MKILLLGVGMQGKAALHDLVHNQDVSQVIAADQDWEALQAHVAGQGYGDRVRCERLDAGDPGSLAALMALRPDVTIDLLPVPFADRVARAAVEHAVHLVNTSYTTPGIAALSDKAGSRGVTVLPEFGLDPGIDLVLAGQAVREFDEIDELLSYGAGIPEPESADNAIRYKVTWTFEGVLRSYHRPARLIRDGRVVEVEAGQIFAPHNLHAVRIEALGDLEAFPNGDALRFVEPLGLDQGRLRHMGRYTLRWPGHSAFWKVVADLGLLDDEPLLLDGRELDRVHFLAAAIEPHIRLGESERDIALVRVEAGGLQRGERARRAYQVLDRRDLGIGLTGMQRTVGFTASIGAWMIGSGAIAKRGVLSPIHDVPYPALVEALGERGVRVTVEEMEDS